VGVVLHSYNDADEDVRVTLDPLQIMPSLLARPEVSVIVIIGVGRGFTVIIVEVTEEQPFALVTVTVYVVDVIGYTVIDAVLSLVLQAYLLPPDVVSVTIALSQTMPSSIVEPEVSATIIVGTGSGFTVIVFEEVAVQPSAFVTVTV
jgi:hypothetical protein